MMAAPLLPGQSPPRLVLASASPRRVELLREAGFDFGICAPEVEEMHDESLTCEALTLENAVRKARAVAALHPESLVLAADTLVYLDGMPLGKPRDMEDAAGMLRQLSGRVHRVCTGVALTSPQFGLERQFTVISDVTFKVLTENVIRLYHGRIQPLDKAGAYAVQDESALIIESVSGSWSNVKGLPMERLIQELETLGFRAQG